MHSDGELTQEPEGPTRDGPRPIGNGDRAELCLPTILRAVQQATGQDFGPYRSSTLLRRIDRRMGLLGLSDPADYARLVETDVQEAARLRQDMLINVTEFFRQAEAWDALAEQVVPELIARTEPGGALRAWVPACATGQEAYSLAMLLVEQVQASGRRIEVQLFATDTDEQALRVARSGHYPASIAAEVSPERLERFFVATGSGYEVVKSLREQVVFAQQDLLCDPPFARLDLVSCRNLLIYLEPAIQRKTLGLFHFALNDGGYLLLGSAESISGAEPLFVPVVPKWRIYRRTGTGRQPDLQIPLRQAPRAPLPPPVGAVPCTPVTLAAQRAMLDAYAPPSAVVDRSGRLLYCHGPIGEFLEVLPGEQTGQIVDMAREALRPGLRAALARAVQEGRPLSIRAAGRPGRRARTVRVTVQPVDADRQASGLLLVSFETIKPPRRKAGQAPHALPPEIEDELRLTREELQATVHQLSLSNEQLKASDEESMAVNEELQAANEELESGKEELQSLNEELNAVNLQLQQKVEELEAVNNDVLNLLSSSSVATIFLDRELRICRFTPQATDLLSLIEADLGRPFADIRRHFVDETLLDDARRVLAELVSLHHEVQTADGRWYARRITPYRTQDGRIEGIVLTFSEVTLLKRNEHALRDSEQRYRLVADFTGDWEFWRAPDGRFRYVSPAVAQVTGYDAQQFLADPELAMRILHPDDREAYLTHLHEVDETGGTGHLDFRIITADGTTRWIGHKCQAVTDADGHYLGQRGSNRDITDRKLAEQALRESEQRYRTLFTNMDEGFALGEAIVDGQGRGVDFRFLEVNDAFHRQTGLGPDAIGRPITEALPQVEPYWIETYCRVALTGEPAEFTNYNRDTGRHYHVHCYRPAPERFAILFRDVTREHLDQEAIARQNALLQGVNEVLEQALHAESEQAFGQACLRVATAITGSEIGFIAETTDEGFMRDLAISDTGWAACGIKDPTGHCRLPGDFPIKGLHGAVLTEGRSHIINDPARHPAAGGLPPGHPTLECLLGVPLLQNGRAVGMIAVANRPGGYRGEDRQALEALAPSILQALHRRRAEATLRQREEFHRQALESIPGMVFTTRPDGYCDYQSQQWVEYTGVPMEQHMGNGWNDLLHPDDRPLAMEAWRQAVEGNSAYDLEYRVRRHDGHYEWFKVRGRPIRDAQGQIVRWFGVATNIDAMKRADDALRETADELARSNQDLEQFAYVASHDLQEPLRMVSGFLGLLSNRYAPQLDDQAREYIHYAVDGAQRMSRLIQDLLEFSRVGTHGREMDPVQTDQAVQSALANCRATVESSGGQVELGPLPRVLGDSAQMTQLFQNLIGNAVKFRRPDVPPRVRITAERQDGQWLFRVADNGIGIDPQQAERIFLIFQRLHTREQYEGTGIGLAICKKIVERHSGRIWVESAPGQGSTFCFTLPANET